MSAQEFAPLARITIDGTVIDVPALETWTGNEWVMLERELGITPLRVSELMRGGAVSLVIGCLWVAQHRVDPLVAISDLGTFAIGNGTLRVEWDPDGRDPAKAAPEEPAPADAADDDDPGAASPSTTQATPASSGHPSSGDSTD